MRNNRGFRSNNYNRRDYNNYNNESTRRSEVRCYHCLQPGHYAPVCPNERHPDSTYRTYKSRNNYGGRGYRQNGYWGNNVRTEYSEDFGRRGDNVYSKQDDLVLTAEEYEEVRRKRDEKRKEEEMRIEKEKFMLWSRMMKEVAEEGKNEVSNIVVEVENDKKGKGKEIREKRKLTTEEVEKLNFENVIYKKFVEIKKDCVRKCQRIKEVNNFLKTIDEGDVEAAIEVIKELLEIEIPKEFDMEMIATLVVDNMWYL